MRPGEHANTLNIIKHSKVAAVVDVNDMVSAAFGLVSLHLFAKPRQKWNCASVCVQSVLQCENEALQKEIELCLRRIRIATQPISAPEPKGGLGQGEAPAASVKNEERDSI